MTVAHINTIDLNNGVADVSGALWYLLDMTGWESPVTRQTALEIPTLPGTQPVEGLYGARIIRVSGLCKAPNKASFYASWNRLTSQTDFLKSDTFVFSVEEDVERQCNVIRDGELMKSHLGVNAFDFQLSMRADDPFKYGATLKSEAFLAGVPETIVNIGTSRTYPIITMNGTGTPTITCGALTWQATGSIPSGTVIDMKRQTMFSGVTSQFDKFKPTSEWITMESGNNTVESSVPMTVEWRDAWV